MSPALLVQAVILVIGGVAVYWSTITEIKAQLTRLDTNHATLVDRLGKVERAEDACTLNRFKTNENEKDIDALQKQLQEFQKKLLEHDEATRRALPLGKRSELEPFRAN